MRWFRSKRHERRHSDWDFYDGYPPTLRMRRMKAGVWETRLATESEMEAFKDREAEFASRPTSSTKSAQAADMQSYGPMPKKE